MAKPPRNPRIAAAIETIEILEEKVYELSQINKTLKTLERQNEGVCQEYRRSNQVLEEEVKRLQQLVDICDAYHLAPDVPRRSASRKALASAISPLVSDFKRDSSLIRQGTQEAHQSGPRGIPRSASLPVDDVSEKSVKSSKRVVKYKGTISHNTNSPSIQRIADYGYKHDDSSTAADDLISSSPATLSPTLSPPESTSSSTRGTVGTLTPSVQQDIVSSLGAMGDRKISGPILGTFRHNSLPAELQAAMAGLSHNAVPTTEFERHGGIQAAPTILEDSGRRVRPVSRKRRITRAWTSLFGKK
ncbi:MAG: hypothetical protein M1818_003105 [Claussenomyces sp. TS43310]|nr:MAG: hypothetical protein M1818_003105 [Claussenomyces sp. TS43310]